MKYIFSLLILLGINKTSHAWSLKTHLWIAQQVLNDVLDDGKLRIDGHDYAVSPSIYNALRLHPDKFGMGCLGPDVFPDPVVGQTTTHPGVINGWPTDKWLKQLLSNAKSPEEIAFSYGFVVHACSDIFAHTYVNAYAGDIFELTDKERDVEMRHFVLEKYIEGLTPQPRDNYGNLVSWTNELSVPAGFLSNNLILNGDVFLQNLKAKTGVHLAGMYAVQRSVALLNSSTNSIIQQFSAWAADYYKMQLRYLSDLSTVQLNLKLTDETLKQEEQFLIFNKQALEKAQGIWDDAKEVSISHVSLINAQTDLLALQVRTAADLATRSLQVSANAVDKLGSLYSKIGKLRKKIADKGCGRLFEPAKSACKRVVRSLLGDIGGLEDEVKAVNKAVEAAKALANGANDLKEQYKKKLDQLQERYNKAIQGLADKSFETAVKIAMADVTLKENVVRELRSAVAKAKEMVDKAQKEVDKIGSIIDQIKDFYDRYNSLTVLLNNWEKGIRKAVDEYILASGRAGVMMVNGSGNPLGEYSRWFSCYGPVFAGMPVQVMEAGCFVTDQLSKIKERYDALINSLPELLQWMLNPTKKASDLIYAELKPVMEDALKKIGTFLTDRGTVGFIDVLINPENATLGKLKDIYSYDHTSKHLLTFQDVSQLILRDLAVENGFLNTEKFGPLRNSVTLAKLALLSPEALNELIRNYVGDYQSPYYGKTVFSTAEPNYTLLRDAVKSIDGNHQWQAYALPYPKKGGTSTAAEKPNYGYDYFADGSKSKGFRLWVDPFIRERVFYQLFPFSAMGSLAENPDLASGRYPFPECPQHPFPFTQDENGKILGSDMTCSIVNNPSLPASSFTFKDSSEYGNLYFTCSAVNPGIYYNSIAAFGSKRNAISFKTGVNTKYPDIKIALAKRGSIFKRWRIIISDCTSKENTAILNDLVTRRQLSKKLKVYRQDRVSARIKVYKTSQQ